MAWILLVVAGLLEAVWATTMKYSNGFTAPLASAVTVVTAAVSFYILGVAMKSLPLGTAYLVWAGIGAVGAFVAGIFLYAEDVSPTRLAAGGMILAGIMLMKLAT